MKEINSREELAGLSHGTVVVLGPKSTVDDGFNGALAIQKIVDRWYAVGLRGSVNVAALGSVHSWPALVVFEAS